MKCTKSADKLKNICIFNPLLNTCEPKNPFTILFSSHFQNSNNMVQYSCMILLLLMVGNVAGVRPSCAHGEIIQDPLDVSCRSFILCVHGYQTVMTCAPGTMFDPAILSCSSKTDLCSNLGNWGLWKSCVLKAKNDQKLAKMDAKLNDCDKKLQKIGQK